MSDKLSRERGNKLTGLTEKAIAKTDMLECCQIKERMVKTINLFFGVNCIGGLMLIILNGAGVLSIDWKVQIATVLCTFVSLTMIITQILRLLFMPKDQ